MIMNKELNYAIVYCICRTCSIASLQVEVVGIEYQKIRCHEVGLIDGGEGVEMQTFMAPTVHNLSEGVSSGFSMSII